MFLTIGLVLLSCYLSSAMYLYVIFAGSDKRLGFSFGRLWQTTLSLDGAMLMLFAVFWLPLMMRSWWLAYREY